MTQYEGILLPNRSRAQSAKRKAQNATRVPNRFALCAQSLCALRWCALAVALVLLLNGCLRSSTPPGASSVGGTLESGETYSLHYWKEGLRILVLYDSSLVGNSCNGTGSTGDPTYRLHCTAESREGRRVNWEVETNDGITAQMHIDAANYDLTKGTVFLIRLTERTPQVVQLQRDLSPLATDYEGVAAFVRNDRELRGLIGEK